ncbi:S8 family peptidase [Rhodopseudomonas palustris]
MAQRPIVRILREPDVKKRIKGQKARFPKPISSGEQARTHNAKFARIENGIARVLAGADMKESPAEVAPDRALVFEVIGPLSTVTKFIRAARETGFDWLGEDYDLTQHEDEDEEGNVAAAADDEGADTGQSALYVTMPSLGGLQRIVALWRRFTARQPKPSGPDGEWWDLFKYLSDVRPWSAKDRVDPALGRYVERMVREQPEKPIRIEVDLWYRSDPKLRDNAREYVEALLKVIDGKLLDFATIEPIRYQAALVEIPISQAEMLSSIAGPIANADGVMKVRPQSFFEATIIEGDSAVSSSESARRSAGDRPAVAALLDGYPVENHIHLAGRLDIQEVDVTSTSVPVARRRHGTSMASLIVHGDLGLPGGEIDRPLKVVPILAAPQNMNVECTPPGVLPIKMVYRAVTALMLGIDDKPAQGEGIVIINHSICDREAPYARKPTYWAKLLDYLSHEFRLLFVVSAGNCYEPFVMDTYGNLSAFQNADPIKRQVAILRCIENAKGKRVILSPAESMNSLTVGAVHDDQAGACPPGLIEPYDKVSGVPNISSSVGLGINRAIKPDLVEAGGRQLIRANVKNGALSAWAYEHKDVGQLTAVPDPAGLRDDRTGRSTGTSNAAALVTRAAIRMAGVAEDLFEQNGQSLVESQTRAVVLKALVAHGCHWGETGELLHGLYPGKWQKKREAVSRSIGYGRADYDRVVTADGHRITLLADDLIGRDESHLYKLPIPRAMIMNREVRRLTMTLAWSSPIDPITNRYRGVMVELVDAKGKRKFWEGMEGITDANGSKIPTGPVATATRRGTLQHLALQGKKLIRSSGTGEIIIGVQARVDLEAFAKERVPYALAVTLEMAQPLRQGLNADVAGRVRLKTRIGAPRPQPRVRT